MTTLEQLAGRRSKAEVRLVQGFRQGDGLIQQPVEVVAGSHVRVRGRWLLNFAATNYLGLNTHPHVLSAITQAASRWGTSLGMPRLFATDRLTARLEREIAKLVGQDRALVFSSTTHLALDMLPLLVGPQGVIFIDEWAYPISLEGARAASQRGARLRRFPHNDHQTLAKMLHAAAGAPDKVVICDGVYSAGGRLAALRQIVRVARATAAVIYIDDAHGVGILGKNPTATMPYGYGGGGTPVHLAVTPGNIAHVGSLSKAFGVPLAFVAGTDSFIDYLKATAASHIHSSPPALPLLAAALAALQAHAQWGDMLRWRLVNRVRRFRDNLAAADIILPANRFFPIQTLYFASPRVAERIGRTLRQKGIWAVLQLQPPDNPQGGVLRFILTAHHQIEDIDKVTTAIVATIRRYRSSP